MTGVGFECSIGLEEKMSVLVVKVLTLRCSFERSFEFPIAGQIPRAREGKGNLQQEHE